MTIGSDVHETETERQLVWHLFHQALYFAANGQWDRAQKSIGAATTLNPLAAELVALREAVEAAKADPDSEGIDVTPFFPSL